MKKMYIVKLADFLFNNGKKMSGGELAQHLNRNNITADNDEIYIENGRGIFTMINATYRWLNEMGLEEERKKFPFVFVEQNGELAWDK